MGLLGGSWALVTIYNWGYNPTCNWGNSYKAIYGGYISRAISPVISSY